MKTDQPIQLKGIVMKPPQVLGGVRLVPLVRENNREDLRLTTRAYTENCSIVQVDRRTAYISYIPHGLVANWTTDGGAVYGSQLAAAKNQKDGRSLDSFVTARGLTKMARREGKRSLRFLPLHVAMEGLLSLHFGGPNIAWSEYSTYVKRRGLGVRSETSIPGSQIVGLEDALRLFEIHHNQIGVLVFVGDALASAFVLPHPSDYAALHHTLLSDFYGELIWYYGFFATESEIQPDPIALERIESLADLRNEVNQLLDRWSALNSTMASELLSRPVNKKRVYRFSPFSLNRFITDLDLQSENFIGETIHADDGTLQYLKTYRLSAAQTRRAYLLKQLAEHDWNLDKCAESLGNRTSELMLRLENAGFGYLLHQHVLDGARAQERKR